MLDAPSEGLDVPFRLLDIVSKLLEQFVVFTQFGVKNEEESEEDEEIESGEGVESTD